VYGASGDDVGGAGGIVVIGGAIHAGVTAVWLKAPLWIGEDDAVALSRQCCLFDRQLGLAFRLDALALSYRRILVTEGVRRQRLELAI
jgi:hypothetical protein